MLIKATPKEIAALVVAVQERREGNDEVPAGLIRKIVMGPEILGQTAVEAMNGMRKGTQDKSLLRPEPSADTED